MACEDVRAALGMLAECVETDQGSRFVTHCLYPAFEPVYVFVVKYGDGYKVHDDGGAMRSAWDMGRDHALARRMLGRQATIHRLKIIDDALVAEVPDRDWLPAAILAVANASAMAANATMERIAVAAESALKDRIHSILIETAPRATVVKEREFPGKSGKTHKFDFSVQRPTDGWLLFDAVAPHHVSIAAKYVAFSDVGAPSELVAAQYAVYDRPLANDDMSLLLQVADIVPLTSLQASVRRGLALA